MIRKVSDKLLDQTLAAQAINLQPRTLARWRWVGRRPAHWKIGGAVRYFMTDLEEFITSNRVAAQ
jgi:hypothetical protein